MLSQIQAWAEGINGIRTILVVGSMAGTGKQDELSDFDISVFGDQFDFISSDNWLDQISPWVICIHEKFSLFGEQIPTRLTLFANYQKVDFSFHPQTLLSKMAGDQQLPPTYDAGFHVLVDKDQITGRLAKPTYKAYSISLPDPPAFALCQLEFWFESYHIAKYLLRQDWWAAKSRDQALKKWLLSMMQWHAAARSAVPLKAKGEGRQLSDWMSEDWQQKLAACFSGWLEDEQWAGLGATLDLFSAAAKQTASLLGYVYNQRAEDWMRGFIHQKKLHYHDH